MITDPRFLLVLPYTLKQECNVYTGAAADWANPKNFDDDRRDPGGATQCGLTHTDWTEYCEANGLPQTPVQTMGQAAGMAIYYTKYWLPFCPKLKPGLDLFFFDTDVNMGLRRAVMLLQASLRVSVDGGWGPKTQAAVDAVTDVAAVIKDEEGRRAATYRSFGTFATFGSDWIRRDQEIGAESIAMAPVMPKPGDA
jgi:lysozyme family protein